AASTARSVRVAHFAALARAFLQVTSPNMPGWFLPFTERLRPSDSPTPSLAGPFAPLRSLASLFAQPASGSDRYGRKSARLLAVPVERILVVEDNDDLRGLYKIALWTAGLQVTQASDGLTALRAIEADRPDLVVLDL